MSRPSTVDLMFGGQRVKITLAVANTKWLVISASRLADQGLETKFTKDGAEIKHVASGTSVFGKRLGNLYFIECAFGGALGSCGAHGARHGEVSNLVAPITGASDSDEAFDAMIRPFDLEAERPPTI